jgi:hypothetical protein
VILLGVPLRLPPVLDLLDIYFFLFLRIAYDMKLTDTERMSLMNQSPILVKIDSDNADTYETNAEILWRRYEYLYGQDFEHMYEP